MRILLLITTILWSGLSEARVFDYKSATVAPYIRAAGGFSALDQDQFINSVGGASVSEKSKYQYGGELGVWLGLSPNVHLLLGAEVIQHSSVANANGSDPAGSSANWFTLNSSVFVFNPNATIEYMFSQTGALHYFFMLGAGYANVTVVNSYKFTPTGSSHYSSIADFDEKFQANVINERVGFGLESMFADNATFVAEAGYRYFPVKSLTQKNDVTTLQGSVHQGDVVKNDDGSARKLNLGGLYVAIAFRFYLNFM